MSTQREAVPTHGPKRPRKTFVLLFDGTGNKFSGNSGDSNILKILRMLDRSDSTQLHYYQPGIGTYVHSATYSHTSVFTRFNSWMQKARDSAVGTSFDLHVMGGYKFLMKYYRAGDDIYFFGFSRGAYIARFLAEMLDYVGLLEPGNEEMARFAWKAFAQWQMRTEATAEDKEKKREMFHFLTAFRETFSRPVRRIRFLGLFDTVNSVPRFESKWMQRSKFPYTARSSAIVIRQAVAIDERRAKFRQDLISGRRERAEIHRGRAHRKSSNAPKEKHTAHQQHDDVNMRYRRKSHAYQHQAVLAARERSMSPKAKSLVPVSEAERDAAQSLRTSLSLQSLAPAKRDHSRHDFDGDGDDDNDDEDEDIPQDIREIWFPGCHADIGGGWPLAPGEDLPLAHGPLVWIVREARKAGLRFDEEKMLEMRVIDPEVDDEDPFKPLRAGAQIPAFTLSTPSPQDEKSEGAGARFARASKGKRGVFRDTLNTAAGNGVLHDCLEFGGGLAKGGVVSWKIMEYLPFRRMDLQPDNSWESIRWPLPKGEVRDMPDDALVHVSALRRMQANPDYRPGNLVIGGGGRGVKKAKPEHGTGEWDLFADEGDPVGECYVRRKKKSEEENVNGHGNGVQSEKQNGKD